MRFLKGERAGHMRLAALMVAALAGGAGVSRLSAQAGAAAAAAPAATPAPTVMANGQHPIEAFAKLPFMESPKLSPDGTRIAARIAIQGVQTLVIIDQRGRQNKYVQIGMGENDLNWWRWVNDDWLVAGIGNEVPVDGDAWYIKRAAAVAADGTSVKILAAKRAAQIADNVIWMAKDGTPTIYLALQDSIFSNDAGFWPHIERIDVSTGKSRQLVAPKEGVMSWYADATGVVRMGIGYDDDRRSSKLYYRASNDVDFKILDRASAKKDESLIVPSLFLADPGKALILDDSDGFTKLKSLDLSNLSIGETVFEVPGYDVDDLMTDVTGNALAGVSFTDTRWKTRWIDPKMAEVQASLDKAVGASRWAHIVSMSRDRQNLIVEVGAPDRNSIYYSYAIAGGVMTVLAKTNEAYGGTPFHPVKSVRYKVRDGLEIEAVVTLPKGKEARNLPLILMPHGGPAARDEEQWDWIAQFLADRGYAVIQPNYRGSTGYGTKFQEKGEGEWGLAMQDDLNDTVDWIVKEGIADPKRVCIVGGSYGGYAAMRGAQRDGARYRCAISYAGVSDLGSMVRYDAQFLNGNAARAYFRTQAPNFPAVSPVNFAAQFSTPILLMHGKMDRTVQVKQSRNMAERLKAAGKTYRYIEQPLGDHHFSRQEDRLQFLKEVEAFLNQYNPA